MCPHVHVHQNKAKFKFVVGDFWEYFSNNKSLSKTLNFHWREDNEKIKQKA